MNAGASAKKAQASIVKDGFTGTGLFKKALAR